MRDEKFVQWCLIAGAVIVVILLVSATVRLNHVELANRELVQAMQAIKETNRHDCFPINGEWVTIQYRRGERRCVRMKEIDNGND